jgi:hypothetical protein
MGAFRISHAGRSLAAAAFLATSAAPVMAQGVTISLRAWREPVLMDTLRQEQHLRSSPAQVYEAVLKAFAQLDLPTGRTDGTRGIIGSERFERVHALVGLPMSRSFSCGESPTGPNADAFRLEIAVVAWVEDAKPGTTLSVASIASGRDMSGVARKAKECVSLGTIETKLIDAVTKIVGG